MITVLRQTSEDLNEGLIADVKKRLVRSDFFYSFGAKC